MSEWDPHAGQAPQELEIDCGELDFSGLQETDLSNMCFPSAPLAIKSASPVDMGRPFWATPGLPVDNSGLAMTTMSTDMRSMPSDLYSSEPNYSYSTMPITPPAENKEMIMTDIMRADLDQVFFERVYPVIPIIYHRRYFSWADKEYPGANRACLRSAMRVMAAAMSAPGRQFCDQLYTETRDLLEAQRIESKADISVEYVQAWLLLAHYELLRVGEYQAMLTAGRCLRLVLMARLSDIDASGADGGDASPVLINRDSVRGDTFSIVEEQRRVFWVSFCLDRSLCLRNEYPLTLQEDMVSCLPLSPMGGVQAESREKVTKKNMKPSVADPNLRNRLDSRPPPRTRSQLPKQPIHPRRLSPRSHSSPTKQHPPSLQLRRMHPVRNAARSLPRAATFSLFPRLLRFQPRRDALQRRRTFLDPTKTTRHGRRDPPPRAQRFTTQLIPSPRR